MAVYESDGKELLTAFDAIGNELQYVYDDIGTVVHRCGVYLSPGTIGCGSICAIHNGALLDIGDGEMSDTIRHNNIIANLAPVAEVNYG